jgi:hypothetical protein
MPIPIIAGLLSFFGEAIGALVDTARAILDTMMSFLQTIFSMFQSFVQSAPTPMKILIFLVFILTIGNVFAGFFLGVRYACDSSNVLYESDNIVPALTLGIRDLFVPLSTIDRNLYVHDNYDLNYHSASPTSIKCINSKPRLYFYSVDILSYPLWLLIIVIFFGTPLIWNYYSRMGALR